MLELLSQSDSLLVTDMDNISACVSYKEWFKILDAIASDRYWQNVPARDSCVHIHKEAIEDGDSVPLYSPLKMKADQRKIVETTGSYSSSNSRKSFNSEKIKWRNN